MEDALLELVVLVNVTKRVASVLDARFEVLQGRAPPNPPLEKEESYSESNIVSEEDIIEEMSMWMDALKMLSESISHPVQGQLLANEPTAVISEEVKSISEKYRHYVLNIRDRFPSISFELAKRLGECNFTRVERLRDSHRVNTTVVLVPVDEIPRNNEPKRKVREPSGRSIQSTTGTSESRPSIFSNEYQSTSSPTESIVSISPSVQNNDAASGRRQYPSLPLGAILGEPMRCLSCMVTLDDIRSRNDWQ